jgi:hypothetical protein
VNNSSVAKTRLPDCEQIFRQFVRIVKAASGYLPPGAGGPLVIELVRLGGNDE